MTTTATPTVIAVSLAQANEWRSQQLQKGKAIRGDARVVTTAAGMRGLGGPLVVLTGRYYREDVWLQVLVLADAGVKSGTCSITWSDPC